MTNYLHSSKFSAFLFSIEATQKPIGQKALDGEIIDDKCYIYIFKNMFYLNV